MLVAPKSKTSLSKRLRQYFLLEEAISRAKINPFTKDSPGWVAFSDSRGFEETANLLADHTPILKYSDASASACLLYCEALHCAMKAHLQRAGLSVEGDSLTELWSALQAPCSSVLSTIDGAVLEKVPTILERAQPQHLSLEDLKALREVTATLVSSLASDVSVASLQRLKLKRLGGLSALVLALIASCSFGIWAHFQPTNWALRRPVMTSSHLDKYPRPPGAVDGITRSLGFHTNEENSPWIRIDLEAVREIHRVKVYNRSDGWSERAIPLIVEGSVDGKDYKELTRRNTDFKEWNMNFNPTSVRYVRLSVPKKTSLHLNEIEVY